MGARAFSIAYIVSVPSWLPATALLLLSTMVGAVAIFGISESKRFLFHRHNKQAPNGPHFCEACGGKLGAKWKRGVHTGGQILGVLGLLGLSNTLKKVFDFISKGTANGSDLILIAMMAVVPVTLLAVGLPLLLFGEVEATCFECTRMKYCPTCRGPRLVKHECVQR